MDIEADPEDLNVRAREAGTFHERLRMSEPGSGPALACIPNAVGSDERPEHFARIKRLFGQAAQDRTAVADGYEFAFDASELEELARFVSLERKCCPFLSFQLQVPAGENWIRLRIHGPPGSRDLIEAEILP